MSYADMVKERNYFVWICPVCGQQYRGPSGHRVAGDDRATSCFHEGVSQPKLERVKVARMDRLEALAEENRHMRESLDLIRRHTERTENPLPSQLVSINSIARRGLGEGR